MAKRDSFEFEITEHIGVISERSKGWALELNKVSWNGDDSKYDIRTWSPDHQKMGKGISLTEDEIEALREMLDS